MAQILRTSDLPGYLREINIFMMSPACTSRVMRCSANPVILTKQPLFLFYNITSFTIWFEITLSFSNHVKNPQSSF